MADNTPGLMLIEEQSLPGVGSDSDVGKKGPRL